MSLLKWNDSFFLNIKEIDNQHKKLVDLINQLFEAMQQGKANDVLKGVINELVNYTKLHFSLEENYFSKFNFEGKIDHISEHNEFVAKISKFKADFDSGKIGISIELMRFLSDWLVKHIKGTDKKYVECLKNNGVN